MAIPIFVISGFLDAGKTTLLNRLLNRWEWSRSRIFVIQFERGEEEFQSCYPNFIKMSFSKKMLENNRGEIALYREKEHPVYFFFVVTFLLLALHYVARPVLEINQFPVNTITNVFLGMILQAVPFLLIGILLSSAIQIFIPESWLERFFPKSLGLGIFAAVIGGFLLPVCDCVSIPVFRSLVRKGIPLPVAVTFMTASPVINPVVILSTYYAFNGNMTIVAGRVCLGLFASILIGISMAVWPPKAQVLSGGRLDMALCSCGCYDDTTYNSTPFGKFKLFLRHSQVEFFSVGKYLMIGILIASVFQVMGGGIFESAQKGTGLAVSITVMMAMAFILSLCSSSDAVIARSFASQFPAGAIMGFLIFGPMMDIKNVMMLTSGFTIRFVGKLLFTTFMVCFAVVFFVYFQGV